MAMLLDFLAERDRYYPIYASLSSYLRIAEIVAVTRTCKKLSTFYQDLLAPRSNIDRDLHSFVDNPHDFRALLKQHDPLISGEFAYRFFKNEIEGTPLLDVFTRLQDKDAIIEYLVQVEGYQLVTRPHERLLRHGKRYLIDELYRETVHGTTSSRIDVSATLEPPLHTILKSLGPVNIISWNTAYAIFPQFDFVEKADTVDAWKCLEFNAYTRQKQYQLYGQRYKVDNGVEEQYIEGNKLKKITYGGESQRTKYGIVYKNIKRHVGDHFTWTIPLTTSDVLTSSNTQEMFEAPHTATWFGVCRAYSRDLHEKKKEDDDDDDDDADEQYSDVLSACWVEQVINPQTQFIQRPFPGKGQNKARIIFLSFQSGWREESCGVPVG